MSFDGVVFQTGKAKTLARLALEHQLHEGALGHLEGILEDIAYMSSGYLVCLASHLDQPIAVCVIDPDNCCMMYVVPAWRQKKVGSRLLHYSLNNANKIPSEMWAWFGNDVSASSKFWTAHNIALPRVHVTSP